MINTVSSELDEGRECKGRRENNAEFAGSRQLGPLIERIRRRAEMM
jgi:hypothetical protein